MVGGGTSGEDGGGGHGSTSESVMDEPSEMEEEEGGSATGSVVGLRNVADARGRKLLRSAPSLARLPTGAWPDGAGWSVDRSSKSASSAAAAAGVAKRGRTSAKGASELCLVRGPERGATAAAILPRRPVRWRVREGWSGREANLVLGCWSASKQGSHGRGEGGLPDPRAKARAPAVAFPLSLATAAAARTQTS